MCGIIGIIGPNASDQNPSWASYEAYRGLLTLQHRGQDAAGLISYDQSNRNFCQHKDLGLVATVFDREKIEDLRGNMAVAHNRYATAGSDEKHDIQPLVSGLSSGVAMVHNGNLLNYHSLVDLLRDKHQLLSLTSNDLEVILNLWCNELVKQKKIFKKNSKTSKTSGLSQYKKATKKVFNTMIGGYAVIGIVAGKGMFGFRDPQGIRPLVLCRKPVTVSDGESKYKYCLSSETVAGNFLSYEYVRDIQPGELIFIDTEGNLQSEIIATKNKKISHCMFEWIYFSAAESTMSGKSVYSVRLNLGKLIAQKTKDILRKKKIKPDIIVPVPDTSRPSAISLGEELKIPYREALIKNRYIQRSFILNSQETREKAIELKLSPIISEIKNKHILLVDDSIVRGTTSKKIISLLKDRGAKSVTIVSTCPPIRYPCYYGIDFPTSSELIAYNRNEDEIAEAIGATQVIYLDLKDLSKAIGTKNLCKACLNKKYPTNIEEGKFFAAQRRGEAT